MRRSLVPVIVSLGCGPSVAASGNDESSTGGTTTTATTTSATTVGTTTSADSTGSTGTSTSGSADDEVDSGFPDFWSGVPDAPPTECGMTGAERADAIWVLHEFEGTVSKIDATRAVEVARYAIAPADAMPQTLSVSLNGDVAITTFHGGVVMIRGNVDECIDQSNTSRGPNDVKPFPDGCVEWFTPMNYQSQRVAAWTAGVLDPETCRYEDATVWTSGLLDNEIEVLRLDGETGVVLDSAPVVGLVQSAMGMFGGAVDSNGDLWGSQYAVGARLAHVDHDTLEVEIIDLPEDPTIYGIAVDRNDRVWLCSGSALRYDPPTGTWDEAPNGGSLSPCTIDADGHVWIAGATLEAIDVDTLEVVESITPPGDLSSRAVAVDFQGMLWAVGNGGGVAYRYDRDTEETAFVYGLSNGAYAYGDFTGVSLNTLSQ